MQAMQANYCVISPCRRHFRFYCLPPRLCPPTVPVADNVSPPYTEVSHRDWNCDIATDRRTFADVAASVWPFRQALSQRSVFATRSWGESSSYHGGKSTASVFKFQSAHAHRGKPQSAKCVLYPLPARDAVWYAVAGIFFSDRRYTSIQ
ncbi:unnamed protein product [Ectocarpus sp. 8 AP-2014]